MGGITLINPFLLTGLLALGIPLAIHLLTRRTPVLIVFPTLRFLQKAQANQSRLFRVRHYLLLLLRSLIVLLLLAAFLRPVLTKGTLAASASPKGTRAAILIVDTSLSMSYSHQGISPLARATVAAETTLGQLGASDLANVILAAAVPQAASPEPQQNRAALRRFLGETQATTARADIDGAIALALEQFDALKGHDLELHFIADFQRSNWAAVDFSAIPETIKTVFVSVAADETANLAITEAGIRPTTPAVGEMAEMSCSVRNFGPVDRQILLRFVRDGEEELERPLQIAAGSTATASFPVRFEAPGLYEGTFSMDDGALAEDDQRHVSVQVSNRFPITLLTDAPDSARGASHRFLRAALDPTGDERAVFIPTVMTPDALDRFVAGQSHAIILCQAAALRESTVGLLTDYLRNGGRIIYFLDGPADRDNLALLSNDTENGIKLPFQPGAYITPESGAYAMLTSANYEEPMLRKFRDTSALADLHFFSYFETRREESQGQVLLKYDNDSIALARTTLSLGTLLLANFSPSLEGSDLQKSTVFLPLVHEMLKALGYSGGRGPNFVAGLPCSTSVTLSDPDAPVRFTNPAGEAINAVLDMNGHTGSVIIPETPTTGFYSVFTQERKLGAMAVNVDARESNLETLSVEQLESLTQRSRETFYARTGSDAGTLRTLREGVPLWYYFLTAALAFLALEQTAAFVWRR